MSDSEHEALPYDGDSDISDLLEESESSDSGKECDREEGVNGRRGWKLGNFIVKGGASDDSKKNLQKFAVRKSFCLRSLRCYPGCEFELLAPELHCEGASEDGPYSDLEDYDSSEGESNEGDNENSDEESGPEENPDKGGSVSDEEKKN